MNLVSQVAKSYNDQATPNLVNNFHQVENYAVISTNMLDWSGDEIELYVSQISDSLFKISDFEMADYNYQCVNTGDNYFATDKTIADDKYVMQYVKQNHILTSNNELVLYSNKQHLAKKLNLLINVISNINNYLLSTFVNKR